MRWFAVLLIACSSPAPSPVSGTGSAPAPIVITDDPQPAWMSDPPKVLRDKILVVGGHVLVLKNVLDYAEYRDVLRTVEQAPGVVAAQPFLFVDLYVESKTRKEGISLKGVDVARVERVLGLGAHMKEGKLSSLATGDSLILGDGLARTLAVKVGDSVTLSSPNVAAKVFQITGTFHVGFDEFDDHLAVAALPRVQALVDRGDQVMGIELKSADIEGSDALAKALGKTLGVNYVVMDWYQLNQKLFTTLYGDRRP